MAQGRLLTLLPPPPPESRSTGRDRSEESDVEGMLDDPFDVVPQKKKEASSVDRLRRWRQAALMLNTSRHVICNLDLKKEEEKMREICRRASTSDTGNLSSFQAVIRAAFRIKQVEGKDLRVTHGAFPPDVPVPALMLEPCAGQKLGLFVSAPEVAIRMLRDQGRPSPFEPNFGQRGRKAGRDGGLPMGRPEPRKIRRGRAYRRWGF
ncbi:uncharacterized protein LOC127781881 [Oryza glaberrima]|uniref:uncharacterized protein LOC127781881 n=1 Tax=Oryza glaberrima TaxID=4538 RepID=UPI00224C1A66|nr:uncharacterized protein LOC127781881 [Oryza glaberrima]